MERCPRCRTKYDPSYTVACSKCGALLVSLGSELTPAARTAPSTDRGHDPVLPEPVSWPKKMLRAYFAAGAPFLLWIILGALGLGGVLVASLSEAERDEAGSIVDTGIVGVLDTQVGDCLDLRDEDADADVIYDFVGAPCSEPHGLEVFAILTYTGVGTYFPGDDALEEFGDEGCVDRFEGYVGVPFSIEPSLAVRYFTPEPEGWAKGDRKITCVLVSPDESDLVGSKKGAGMIHSQYLSLGCYDMPDDPDTALLGLYPRSCDDPHDVEVYAVEKERLSTKAEYDEERVLEFGDRTCQAEYDSFMGASRTSPDFGWSYYYPTPETWAVNDRKVACLLMRLDGGQITGSVQAGAGADA